ncbi:MAG: hypothetical protein M3415_02305 [Actinomycetota bacterium]|nr:hypothetical protein [Actinomycetota bacterium]
MAEPAERTVSGRALVTGAGVLLAVALLAQALFGPSLVEQVRQEQRPRTLREPIAAGEAAGQPWEAVGRFDGTANCLELRYRDAVLDRACTPAGLREEGVGQVRTTTVPEGGPTVVYGTAGEGMAAVDVQLDDGTTLRTPVRAGELGFPVGFWAVPVPDGAGVRAVTTARPSSYSGGQG